MDPLLGINAPVRLLREQWQSPTALAQELYAMFTAKGPREINDTLTIRVRPGQPALRIIQQDGDTVINEGPTHHFGVTKNTTPVSTAVPGTKPRPRPGDDASRPTADSSDAGPARPRNPISFDDPPGPAQGREYGSSSYASPAVEFGVATRFTAPAVFDNALFSGVPSILDARRRVPVPLDQYVRDAMESTTQMWNDKSTSASFGEVLDGNENVGYAWTVALRKRPLEGAFIDPGAEPKIVTVYVPTASDSTPIPVGTVIGPIVTVGREYYYQQPPSAVGPYWGEVLDRGDGNQGSPWLVALRSDPTTPVYCGNPENPPTYAYVYIPFIDPTETAPVGSVAGPIFRINGYYYHQPPVWLE